MSQKTLLQFIIDYLLQQKSYGRKSVRRGTVYTVSEFQFGVDAIFSGKALTRGLMSEAATAVGGVYVPGKNGNSKVVF